MTAFSSPEFCAFTYVRISSRPFVNVASFFLRRFLKETTRFGSLIAEKSGGGVEKDSVDCAAAPPNPLPVAERLPMLERPKPLLFIVVVCRGRFMMRSSISCARKESATSLTEPHLGPGSRKTESTKTFQKGT
jgi:hypothetical protein